MPDVGEVYRMVTQQKSPEPGALERQQTKQVRSARNKKFGALAGAGRRGDRGEHGNGSPGRGSGLPCGVRRLRRRESDELRGRRSQPQSTDRRSGPG